MADAVDPELLEKLLNDHAAALELFAAQWTNAPEDCVQEAFLELARQTPQPTKCIAWLYRVVRNRAISAARRAQRRRRHETQRAAATTWFQHSPTELIDGETLTRGLRQLAEKHREVIVARIWGGLSYEEIAEVLGISTSSAHRRYEAGLKALREELGLSWLTKKSTSPA